MTVENAQGKLEFTRPTTDTWTLTDLAAGETFNPNNLTWLLDPVERLRYRQTAGKNRKAGIIATPSATLTIVSQPAGGTAKTTTTLVIGQQNAESQSSVAKSSDSEYMWKLLPLVWRTLSTAAAPTT